MSLSNYLKHHSYIDMDYVYGTLSNSRGEYPLDYRARRYNEQVATAKEWEKEDKVLIVSPDDTEGVSTLSKNGRRWTGCTARATGTVRASRPGWVWNNGIKALGQPGTASAAAGLLFCRRETREKQDLTAGGNSSFMV